MADPEEGAIQKRHWVRLTRVCNQRCLFCLDRDAQNGGMLDVAAVRRDLDEGRQAGLTRVVLSGGEPTMHPRFLEIVSLARALGYRHIQIITNGRRLCYRDFLSSAVSSGLDEVTFSLHGHNAPLHDRLTRVPGSFVQAVAGLRHALSLPGLIVSVDVVINKLNLSVLRDILDFFINAGVREFDLLALVPFSDAWRHRDELFCDLGEPANLAHLRRALELSRRPDLHIWTNRLRAEFLEGFEALIQSPVKIHDEVRGRRKVFARYFKTGRMVCEGDGCSMCFLRDFCGDLAAVRERGGLAPRPGPLCLPEASAPPDVLRAGEAPDIDAFAKFFIQSRYFAKGSACRGCADAARCDGAPVVEIKRRGFSSLKPEAI